MKALRNRSMRRRAVRFRRTKGGYRNVAAPVQAALDAFNSAFTDVLKGLNDAWHGVPSGMGTSIAAMHQLRRTAATIFAFPLPDGSGVYGPTFQLLP